jgi:hypothetical protein
MTDNPFQLSGFVFPGINEDPFGLWDVVPAASGMSYVVGDTTTSEAPVHRGNFISSSEGAAQLKIQQRELQDQQATLTQIEQRLAEIGRSGGGVSFAAPIDQPPEFVVPEQSLDAALQRLATPVSYGLFDRKKQAEQEDDFEATSQWHQFLEQARAMITNYARVETAIVGVPIGQTAVGWTGDFRTIWTPSVTAAGMQVHRHNVDLTLQWRLGTLRMVGVVGAGAANIAVKLAVPGGQLLVIPAVWNFVKDVLKEWRKLQAIKSNEQ